MEIIYASLMTEKLDFTISVSVRTTLFAVALFRKFTFTANAESNFNRVDFINETK
jgi:hypothetical protein